MDTDPTVWDWFGYKQNTTNCGDGTFCMNPGNETCCLSHKGTKEITYHNSATIPTVANALATYYEDANYSIPSTTSGFSTSTAAGSQPTSISQASQSQTPNNLPASSSQHPSPTNSTALTPIATTTTALSSHEKAAIGTGSALGGVGVLGIVCSIYLYRRSRNKRSGELGLRYRAELDSNEQIELSGDDVRSEMDATLTRPLDRARLKWSNELMGHDPRHSRAELSA